MNYMIDSDSGNRYNSPFYNPDNDDEPEVATEDMIAEWKEEADYIVANNKTNNFAKRRLSLLIDNLERAGVKYKTKAQ